MFGSGDAMVMPSIVRVGQPRFCAANVNVNTFTLDTLKHNSWKTSEGVRYVGIGEAGDDLGGKHVDDVVGGARLIDGVGFTVSAISGHHDFLARWKPLQASVSKRAFFPAAKSISWYST